MIVAEETQLLGTCLAFVGNVCEWVQGLLRQETTIPPNRSKVSLAMTEELHEAFWEIGKNSDRTRFLDGLCPVSDAVLHCQHVQVRATVEESPLIRVALFFLVQHNRLRRTDEMDRRPWEKRQVSKCFKTLRNRALL